MASRSAAVTVLCALAACSGRSRAQLGRAGGDRDEGAGELARASRRLLTPTDDAPRPPARDDSAYGGNAYGGTTYAHWRVPQWNYTMPNRVPSYAVTTGLTGVIEGTVSWAGPPPGKLASPCGPIDNPSLRVSSDRHVRGVIVYIDKVAVGRPLPYYSRPASVGGVIAKRACTLSPAAQIVTPLPASIAIHGDAARTKLRIAGAVHDLQEGGLVQVEIKPGVTAIESADGRLAPAWVLGLETPYYAVTDDRGRYRLEELAPGTYDVTFWQPPVVAIGPDGTWSYGGPIVVRRSVTIPNTAAKLAHLSVALPVR